MTEIKLSTQQISALVRSGFAPEFASLAKILHAAVAAGTEQLYNALATPDVPADEANALYALAKTARTAVADEALVELLTEEVSLDAFPRVLQTAAEFGAKAMYKSLEPRHKEKADGVFGPLFQPEADPLQVDGAKGDLEWDEIVSLIINGNVSQFNYSTNLRRIVLDGNAIVVHRDGWPEYRFHEEAAAEAIYDGMRLSMPDIQGFSCTFQFA